jgi:hypothetical protein
MTARQVYEAILTELNKVQAPSVLLEDFNYFGTKAINQYSNKMYNFYDINQQKSDDLRVLKSTAVLTPILTTNLSSSNLLNNTFEVYLPDDYVHMLGCIIEYSAVKKYKCFNPGDLVQFNARRLTADLFPAIINNYYMRPSYKNPYFYINNVNISNSFQTSDTQIPVFGEVNLHTYATLWNSGVTFKVGELMKYYDALNFYFYECITAHTASTPVFDKFNLIGGGETTIPGVYTPFLYNIKSQEINRLVSERYGNHTKVRMEIRYGKDASLFLPSKVYVDYLRAPEFIRLTQEQIDEVSDTSQILEFPDNVCLEIINILVGLLLENSSDPRQQSNIPINQTIGNSNTR